MTLLLGVTAVAPARLKLPAPLPTRPLRDLDGKVLDFKALRGRVVLVDFWATWCGPCREEVPVLKALQSRYGSRGFSVVGLSLDENARPVDQFRKAQALNYPVAMADLTCTAAFGAVLGLPTLFLADRQGTLVILEQGSIKPKELRRQIERLWGPAAKVQ